LIAAPVFEHRLSALFDGVTPGTKDFIKADGGAWIKQQ
jgi:hypothetical protein